LEPDFFEPDLVGELCLHDLCLPQYNEPSLALFVHGSPDFKLHLQVDFFGEDLLPDFLGEDFLKNIR
jgi:hypothetical protein